MALFQDKRKPVDIYAEGSPTVRAQDKMNRAAGGVADSIGNASGRYLGGNAINAVAEPIIRPLREGREKQKLFLAQQGAKVTGSSGNREADSMLYGGEGRTVGGTGFNPVEARKGLGRPVVQPPTIDPVSPGLQRDGIQSQRIDQPTQQSFARATQQPQDAMAYSPQQTRPVFTQDKNGQVVRSQQPISATGPQVAGVGNQSRLSMNQQVGNLDIQFAPGTDEGSIRRFMANPVRPTAQINRFDAQRGQDAGQGQRAAVNADRILGTGSFKPAIQPSEQELFTKANSDMGWKARKELNQQILANRQSGQNAQLQAETARAGDINAYNIADLNRGVNLDKNNIDREQAGNAFALGKDRNAIEREQSGNALALGKEKNAIDREQVGLTEKRIDAENNRYATQQAKEENRANRADQRAADANRIAQAKLVAGDEGGDAGLASTYNPRTPPPGPDASQIEQGAFGAWQRHNVTNITADIDKGEKAQKIYDKYFSNATPENHVALLRMLPPGVSAEIATIARSKYSQK